MSPEDLSSILSINSKGKGRKTNHPLLLTSCNLLKVTAKVGMIIPRTNIPNTHKNLNETIIKRNKIA
tara:strand:- start:246 stop:446 length:201 start_codon:yes stop_codon:yes gene_type:complete